MKYELTQKEIPFGQADSINMLIESFKLRIIRLSNGKRKKKKNIVNKLMLL